MSKFQSTVSTVAALCSIFGVAAAGWKVTDSLREYETQKSTIETLKQQLKAKEETPTEAPQALNLPPAQPAVVQAPPPVVLPPQPQPSVPAEQPAQPAPPPPLP